MQRLILALGEESSVKGKFRVDIQTPHLRVGPQTIDFAWGSKLLYIIVLDDATVAGVLMENYSPSGQHMGDEFAPDPSVVVSWLTVDAAMTAIRADALLMTQFEPDTH